MQLALSLEEDAAGPAAPEVAAALSNLALVLKALGEISEAEALLERAVDVACLRLPRDRIARSLSLWPDLQTRGGRFGRGWLVLIGLAYFGAGIFAPDPTSTIESRLHGLSGLIIIFSSPIVFTLLTRSLMHNQRWAGRRRARPDELKWRL